MFLLQSFNKRKQQIDENSNTMANGDWIIDSDSGVDVKKLTNQPGLIVTKNKGTEVRREPGVPLPSYVMEDKQDSERAVNTIWGAQDILKGQNPGANVPARTSILLERNAQGRLALQRRHFELGMQEVYEWVLHLMKLFYDEERTVAVFTDEGEVKAWEKISGDMVRDDMQLYVKAGSTEPRDIEIIKANAKELYMGGKLDPETYFTISGDFPDPHEAAIRQWKFEKGTLFEEPQPSIEDVTRDELQAILQGEKVGPNQAANELTIQIQAEAMKDRANYPFTDPQIAVLEQKIQAEMQMVQARKQKQLADQRQAMVPQDIAPQPPAGEEAVPPEQMPPPV